MIAVTLLSALSSLAALYAGWQAGNVGRLQVLSRPVPRALLVRRRVSLALFLALYVALLVAVVLTWDQW